MKQVLAVLLACLSVSTVSYAGQANTSDRYRSVFQVADTSHASGALEILPEVTGESTHSNCSASSTVTDTNNEIPAKSLSLLSPVGTTEWISGRTNIIRWTSANVDSIRLEFSCDGGVNWQVIKDSYTTLNDSYVWSVSLLSSPNCFIRITDTTDASVSDINDVCFKVHQPVVTVTSPNGGESWLAGTTQTITWTSDWVDTVKIEYSVDNGATWHLIDISQYSTNSYFWVLPDNPSTTCLVRITETGFSYVHDQSNAVFTIEKASGPPSIHVLSPNGGENLPAKGAQYIRWTSTNVETVKLEYSTNNGYSWNTIQAGISPATGTYRWLIPDYLSTKYLVKITDTSDSSVTDQSDATFNVLYDVMSTLWVKVYRPNGGDVFEAGTQQELIWFYTNKNDFVVEYSIDNGTNWIFITSTDTYEVAKVAHGEEIFVARISWTVPNTPSTQCLIRLKGTTDNTIIDQSDSPFTLIKSGQSMVEPAPAPDEFLSVSVHPNPFNPQTTLSYELSQPAEVTISIYNALGQQVRRYAAGMLKQGTHETVFDAADLTSGVYLYRIEAGYSVVTGKMLYMK